MQDSASLRRLSSDSLPRTSVHEWNLRNDFSIVGYEGVVFGIRYIRLLTALFDCNIMTTILKSELAAPVWPATRYSMNGDGRSCWIADSTHTTNESLDSLLLADIDFVLFWLDYQLGSPFF